MQHLCSFPSTPTEPLATAGWAEAENGMRRSTSDGELSGQRVRFGDTGAAGRMLDNFARRERERRASFSEIQSWEGLQVCTLLSDIEA